MRTKCEACDGCGVTIYFKKGSTIPHTRHCKECNGHGTICDHPKEKRRVITSGKMHFSNGEVWDDLKDEVICMDCNEVIKFGIDLL